MPSSACKKSADRKSTRLNSSHTIISYAVFCLKKKNNQRCNTDWHPPHPHSSPHPPERALPVCTLWSCDSQPWVSGLGSLLTCCFFFFNNPATAKISPFPHPNPLPF